MPNTASVAGRKLPREAIFDLELVDVTIEELRAEVELLVKEKNKTVRSWNTCMVGTGETITIVVEAAWNEPEWTRAELESRGVILPSNEDLASQSQEQ